MSKEFEALSRIEDCLYEDPYADRKDVSYENDIATIKQALLKQLGGSQYTNIFIDEAIKPSEALKELEQMREFGNHFWVADKVNKSYITIKEYILKAQEQEKENAKYKQLQEDLGCPLDMILNLMKNSNTLDEYCHTQDIYFDYKGKLISGSFIKLEYNDEFIINVETAEMFDSPYDVDDYDLKVKDYKNTWWLKEDKSE